MVGNRYSLSFTTGAALILESVTIANLKLELGDWAAVRVLVLKQNTLQARTESTLKKLFGEISRRLKSLTNDELKLLTSGAEEEQKKIIWLAICRHYTFINDFAVEVIYEHFDKAQYKLISDDYDAFFNAKAEWHSNLDDVSDQTKRKAKQVVFKMMRDCGLLNEQKEIMPQHMSPMLIDLIQDNDINQIRLFPGAGI